MTREEYLSKKSAIDEAMEMTRQDERREIRDINVNFDMELEDISRKYRRERAEALEKKTIAKDKISSKYKAIRRDLWAKENIIITEWRDQQLKEGGEDDSM